MASPKLPDFSELTSAFGASGRQSRIEMRAIEGAIAPARRLPSLAAAEGYGLQTAGEVIAHIGASASATRLRQDQLEAALADASWSTSRSNIDYEASKEQNPAALRSAYHEQYETAFKTAASSLGGPQRELWAARHRASLNAARVGANQRADALDRGIFLGKAEESFQNYKNQFLRTSDPKEHARIVREVGALSDSLVANGYTEPVWAEKHKNDFATSVSKDWLEGQPPETQLAFARQVPIGGNAAAAYKFFTRKGLTPEQASGAIGGFIAESGKDLDPNTVNPGDGADGSDSIGIGQWNGERAIALNRFAAARGKPWNDLDTQLEFAWSELNQSEREAGDRLKAARTVDDAAAAWVDYERPRGFEGGLATVRGGADRLRAARVVMAQLHDKQSLPDTRLALAIPPDQLKQIGDKAERDLERRTLADQLLFRNEQASVRGLSADDIHSIIATGKEIPEITPQRVEAALGATERAVFERERRNAHDYFTAMHDISTVPDDQLDARAASLNPAPGALGFSLRQGYVDTARKHVAELRKLREDDPARSVSEFPSVAEVQGASIDRPSTFRPLALARIGAQEQIGIPEELRVPITATEAKRLWAVVASAPETEKITALQFVTKTLKDATGDYADNALAFILRQAHAGQEMSVQASFLLRKLGQGDVASQHDAAAVNEAATREAGRRASDLAPRARRGAAEPLPVPARPYPLPPDDAIRMLKARPGTAPQFDARFGPGAARRVMEGPSG